MDETDQAIVRERFLAGFLALLGLYTFAHSIVVAGRSKVAASEILLAPLMVLATGAVLLVAGYLARVERGLQDLWSLILLIVPISLTYAAFKNIKEIRHETVRILEVVADTVDLRNIYTGRNSKRVAEPVAQILLQLKISRPRATRIEIAARLREIEKFGIPDSILMKPGRLLKGETALMRTHSQEGADLISKYKDVARGAFIIRQHHERWDGHGYPPRLKGAEIPFGARVIAVADSYDAMISDRPSCKALTNKRAIQTLLEGGGRQWDPKVVNAFVDMIADPLEEKPGIRCTDEMVASEGLQTSPISSR